MKGKARIYLLDFLIRLDTDTSTTLIVQVKGYRGHDAMLKADTMRKKWIPAINRNGKYEKWRFAELHEVHDFVPALDAAIQKLLNEQ